jgi:serine protease Do
MNARPLIGLLALLAPAAARAEDSGARIVQTGTKSAVQVVVPVGGGRASIGSGSVINLQQGYVLTNWHVVREQNEAAVIFPIWEKGKPVSDKDRYRQPADLKKVGLTGKVVARDEKVDLAVIKLDAPRNVPAPAASVRFAADSPSAGAKLHSIGNPGASEAMWVYTPGDVRAVYKKKWNSAIRGGAEVFHHEAKVIEATSPTSPGDSGGPCFNDKGEQVGVTQGGLDAKVAQGYSYFIDVTEVKAFLKAHKIAFNVANDVVSTAAGPEAKKDDPKKGAADDELARQEKAATSMLNLLRPLAKDPNRKSYAIEKLDQLVKMYPKTEAAKEAQALLKQIR